MAAGDGSPSPCLDVGMTNEGMVCFLPKGQLDPAVKTTTRTSSLPTAPSGCGHHATGSPARSEPAQTSRRRTTTTATTTETSAQAPSTIHDPVIDGGYLPMVV